MKKLSKVIALCLILIATPAAWAANASWVGGTSTDYNTTANWNPATLPTVNGDQPTINSIPANICTITANPSFKPGDIFVGNGATGRLDLRAGSVVQNVVGTTGNWSFVGIGTGGNGTINIANTSVTGQAGLTTYGQGSGSFTGGKLWIGSSPTANGTGVVNINTTGTVALQSTGSGNSGSIILGNAGTGNGTLNLEAGTVTAAGEVWVCNASTAQATINQTGGSIANNLWFCVGRQGPGVYNMSGGTADVAKNANAHVSLGSIGASTTGTLNLSGGTITCYQDPYIGENGIGVLSISGTGTFISPDSKWTFVGKNTGSAGTINLNGGTLNVRHIEKGSGAGTLNLNGGTLKVNSATDALLTGLTVYVKAGGAIIDTAGFNKALGVALLTDTVSTGGGLTKTGNGTLTLSGANTYTGTTMVSQGSLGGTGTIAGPVSVSAGAGFNFVNGSAGGTLTLANGLALSSGNTMAFEVGAASDVIAITAGSYTAPSSAVSVSIVNLVGLTSGTHKLITGASGILLSHYNLVTPAPAGYNWNLQVTGNDLELAVSIASPAAAFWTGASGSSWTIANNWNDADTSGSPVINPPGAPTDVTFSAAGAANETTSSLNGSSFTINKLTFDTSAGNVAIGATGAETLTVNMGVINNSANAQAINVPVILGAAQTIDAATANITLGSTMASGGNTLTVSGANNTTISGAVSGSGSLMKTGAGTMTVSGGSAWGGSGASSGGHSAPLIAQEGTLLFNGASTPANSVTGELVIGGVVTHGGAGQNAKVQVDAGTLNVSTWLSVGRGNGVGGVSSDLVLNNAAQVTAGNLSAGYNANNTANLPKGSITLNGSSSLAVGGVFYVGESYGSDMTMTVKDTATVNCNGNWSPAYQINVSLNVGGVGKGAVEVNGGTLTAVNGFSIVCGWDADSSMTINSGVVNSGGDVMIGGYGDDQATLNVNGGTFNFATTALKWLYMGYWDTVKGVINLSNGEIKMQNNSSLKFARNGGTHVVNQTGGTMTFYSNGGTTIGGTGALDLQLNSGTPTCTYNLDGGVLTVPSIISSATTGTRTFNFNGGTLKAASDNVTLLNLGAGTGTARANVRDGGAFIDTDGKNVTIAQALLQSNVGGDVGTGGLTKNGNGTLFLNGVNTYTGSTIVNAGTLSGTGTIAGPVTVQTGASLAPGASIGTLTINNTLTLNANSTTVIEINKGGSPASDTVAGVTTLNAGGTLQVINSGANFAAGDTFQIFPASGTTYSGQFAAINPANPNNNSLLAWDTAALATTGALVVHAAPVPPAMTAGTVTNKPVSIAAGKLLALATGEAGETLGIPAVNSTSAQGGTVTYSAGVITYTPPTGHTAAFSDSFTYTLSDGRGGVATGTVTVDVGLEGSGSNGANIISVSSPAANTAVVKFAGIPGAHYAIERTEDFATWTVVATDVTVPGYGIVTWTDTGAPSSAFYRTRYVSGL